MANLVNIRSLYTEKTQIVLAPKSWRFYKISNEKTEIFKVNLETTKGDKIVLKKIETNYEKIFVLDNELHGKYLEVEVEEITGNGARFVIKNVKKLEEDIKSCKNNAPVDIPVDIRNAKNLNLSVIQNLIGQVENLYDDNRIIYSKVQASNIVVTDKGLSLLDIKTREKKFTENESDIFKHLGTLLKKYEQIFWIGSRKYEFDNFVKVMQRENISFSYLINRLKCHPLIQKTSVTVNFIKNSFRIIEIVKKKAHTQTMDKFKNVLFVNEHLVCNSEALNDWATVNNLTEPLLQAINAYRKKQDRHTPLEKNSGNINNLTSLLRNFVSILYFNY